MDDGSCDASVSAEEQRDELLSVHVYLMSTTIEDMDGMHGRSVLCQNKQWMNGTHKSLSHSPSRNVRRGEGKTLPEFKALWQKLL